MKDIKKASPPPICLTEEDDAGTHNIRCFEWEWVATAHTCSNLPDLELCGMKAECDTPGLSNDNIDPPNPFPFYNALKYMVVGDSISHGMEADWTWRYRVYEWRK